MVGSIFERAQQNQGDLIEPLFRLERLSDIWRLSEDAFFVLGAQEPSIGDGIQAIRDRKLMQRALSINIATVKGHEENVEQYRQFQKLFADPRGPATAKRLAKAVYDDLPGETQAEIAEHEVRLDFPRSPSLSDDAEQCHVLVGPEDARTLKMFFPTEDWVASYADNKLTCHVFAMGDKATRTSVADAAEGVLHDLYHFELDPTARRALKLAN